MLLLFADREAAERRIGGVAAVAHVAAEAAAAGAREIRIATGGPPLLSAEALADVERAAGAVPVRLEDRHGGGEALRPFRSAIPLDDASAALRHLLRNTGKRSDGVVSRHLNRPVSRAISALMLQIPGLRPWHATAATAGVACAMFLSLVAVGGWGGLVAGGLLFHSASVMDGVDGEVARVTYRSSERGAVLDTLVDMSTNILFYLGLTISLTGLQKPHAALVTGWAVLAGLTGFALLSWIVRQAGEPGDFDILKRHYRDKWRRGVPRLFVETFVMITSRDFFALGAALIILAGEPRLVSLGLAGFATIWVAMILIAVPGLLRSGASAGGLAVERGPSLP